MEVVVLDAVNPPTKPVLAIHAGSVRRQARLEVNQPFIIPHPGAQTCTVEVSLFEQLASHVLPDDGTPEVLCNIPVRRPDGLNAEVQLRVRRGGGVKQGEDTHSQDPLSVTKDYLDQHRIQQRIQGLIQEVLREQPHDPYRYMLEQLRQSRAQPEEAAKPVLAAESGASEALTIDIGPHEEAEPEAKAAATEAARAPLVPRPPELPKRPGARPQAGGRNYLTPSAAGASPSSQANRFAKFSEVQKLAFHTIREVLRSPQCVRVAEESLRQSVRRRAADGLAHDIVVRSREKTLAKVVSSQSVREQARTTISCVFRQCAVLLSPQHNRAVTRWAVYMAFKGAVGIMGADETKRKDCLHPSFGSRRTSAMPTPIVFLNTEASWGQWLASSPAAGKRDDGETQRLAGQHAETLPVPPT